MRRLSIYIAAVIGFCASPAPAWWADGHGLITDGAVQHLPPALREQITVLFPTIRQTATGEPAGQHYIDIDVYPEFLAGTFPRDINVLIATYGASFVNSNGRAPWVIGGHLNTLTQQMQAAQTPAQRLELARSAGALAHYIEDIHQPLHTTRNFDGQLTGNSGIHARYEGTMVNQHLSDLAIAPTPADCVLIPDIVDLVLDGIETTTWGYVDDLMAADTLAAGNPRLFGTAYYNSMWTSTGTFTHAQFQTASEMVASAWYTAWQNAGQPTFIPEPCALGSLGLIAIAIAIRRTRRLT